ncbi:hypothetical protein STRMOE7_01150 [Streptomyces sp. MOE7]|nr:hypothetical protein STRMOE7_01150 [Streptomyces sp. MOE7]
MRFMRLSVAPAGVTLCLEGGGVVLAVELGDGTPVQAAPGVFRVRQFSVHGGFEPQRSQEMRR